MFLKWDKGKVEIPLQNAVFMEQICRQTQQMLRAVGSKISTEYCIFYNPVLCWPVTEVLETENYRSVTWGWGGTGQVPIIRTNLIKHEVYYFLKWLPTYCIMVVNVQDVLIFQCLQKCNKDMVVQLKVSKYQMFVKLVKFLLSSVWCPLERCPRL